MVQESRINCFRSLLFIIAAASVMLGFCTLVYIAPRDLLGQSLLSSSRASHLAESAANRETIVSKDKKLFNSQIIKQISQEIDVDYIKGLSSSQSADILRYMGITHLSGKSALRFLQCPGLAMLKQHVDSNGNLHIPNYQTCKKMSFQDHGQAVGLLSYPGSGNSWVRQLLETSTGVYTGSVFCDYEYIKAGMIGESVRSGNVIAVKSHFCKDVSKFSKMIYIVRNPFDAVFADFNRKVMRRSEHSPSSHVDELSTTLFDKLSHKWSQVVTVQSNKWLLHIQECLQQHHTPTVVVKYENLKANLMTELRRIFDFLGYNYTENDLQCTLQSTSEKFHRKHTADIDPYSPEQKKFVVSVIQKANKLLSQYNITYPLQ